MNRVLIISPHPDDEVFGCGGLIDKLNVLNKQVYVIILSKGEAIPTENKITANDVVEARARLTDEVFSSLKVESINRLDFPDGNFEGATANQIATLRNLIDLINPDTLFLPHYLEGSPDHVYASRKIKELTDGMSNIARFYFSVWLWHHPPISKVFRLKYNHAFLLPINTTMKTKLVRLYSEAKSSEGIYYSGLLPKQFLKSIQWKNELFFSV